MLFSSKGIPSTPQHTDSLCKNKKPLITFGASPSQPEDPQRSPKQMWNELQKHVKNMLDYPLEIDEIFVIHLKISMDY